MLVQGPPITVPCTVALGEYLRVKHDVTNGLAVCGATDLGWGTLNRQTIVTGVGAATVAAVLPWGTPGKRRMIAAGVIAQYAVVYGAAGGKVAASANGNPIGFAFTAATADGAYVDVLEVPQHYLWELQKFGIPLTDLKVWDTMQTNLPGTSANDDLGLITGSLATDMPSVRTSDLKSANATSRYAGFLFALPPDYVAGETVTARVNAGMTTTVADTTCTLDLEVYELGDPTADICATAAQSMNSTDFADLNFTITPTDLLPGDMLLGRLHVACDDGAGGTAVLATIAALTMLADCQKS